MIIHDYTPQVELFKATFNYTDQDFEDWQDQERHYLSAVLREPEYDILAVSYIESLNVLAKAQ
jgi:hypothetical protein